jgi:uncharacterized protein (TIGR03086 family)
LWGFDAVVRRLTAADWTRATPCERWDVGHLIFHNALLCWATAEMVRGRPMAVPQADAPDGTAAPAAGHVFRPDLITTFDGAAFLSGDGDAAGEAWRTRRDDVLGALDQPGVLDQATMSPWGQDTIDAWLGFLFYDTVVHTWDLARSADQPVVLDDGLVTRAYETLAATGESFDIRIPISLAAARDVPADGAPLERLIAFAGRDPAWVTPTPT